MFMLDMKAPGIEVRPIHQMSDEYEFCEVFLTDVRIPDSHRLGDECDGWKVMLSTLMHERMSLGGVLPSNLHEGLIDLARKALWNGKPAVEEPPRQSPHGHAYLSQKGVELIISRGLLPFPGTAAGPEMSIRSGRGQGGILDIAGIRHGTGWLRRAC